MKMYLISDNPDTCIGMRLAGVEGVVVQSKEEFQQAFQAAVHQKDIGIILIMERFGREYSALVDEVRLNQRIPLILEIPDRNGTGRNPNFITDYVGEAIGLKL